MLQGYVKEDDLKNIIKDRPTLGTVEKILKEFVVDKEIYVPFLYDGNFETVLSENNSLCCKPGDANFEVLWETLEDNPAALSTMIRDTILPIEHEASFPQILKMQKGGLPMCFTLMNMCKRSDDRNLLGGLSKNREDVFHPNFLMLLGKYEMPFRLTGSPKINKFIFQDLTYLSDDEIQTIKPKGKFVFVTDKSEHLYFFNGENCSALEEHFLIWR